MTYTFQTINGSPLCFDPLSELFSRGVKALDSGDIKEARDIFIECVASKPNWYEANINLASSYQRLNRVDDAINVMNAIMSIYPQVANGWFGLSLMHTMKDQHTISAACADQACRIEPRNAKFRWERCQQFLSMGDFHEGWEGMESRLWSQKADYSRPPNPPYFEGQGAEEDTLLIWSEQGVGEQLMTASMYEEAPSLCKKIILEVDDRLVNVMKRSFPEFEVYSSWENGARVDAHMRANYQLPAFNLARFFRRSFGDFPDRGTPYIKVDDERTSTIRARYEALANGRPIIGIAWKSNAKGRAQVKSVPLEAMRPIFEIDEAFFVSVQYDINDGDGIGSTPIHVDPESNYYGDYDQVLSQLAACDAVVTVSNTVLHSAGAISVPTMAILNSGKGRHWYWFLRRHDCPWYPSVNLFRPEPATDGETWYSTSIARIAERIRMSIAK